MKLSLALEYERLREDPASWNKIYLNHDGKFFHAYEWSAWLIKTVACTEEFLGAFIKPYRTYICNRSLSRIRQEAADVRHMGRGQAFRTVNSLLGVMSHYNSYNLRREIFTQQHILRYGTFDSGMTTFTLSKPVTAMCA